MFESFAARERIHMAMSASTLNIDEAEARLCAFLADCDNIDLFAVRILLREALLNAVLHGSREAEKDSVSVDAVLEPAGLVLTVRDNGPGFAWQEAGTNMDILADSGRGIPLMHIYASEVVFNAAGNEVTLYRDYQDEPISAVAEGGAGS